MAAALVVVVLAAACTGTRDQAGLADGTAPSTATVPPPVANVHLTGLIGTAPLTDVPNELRSRLKRVDPSIGADAPSAVRPYDAVVIAALAAEAARTDAPSRIAANIIDVTSGGSRCQSFDECRQLTDTSSDLHYTGASGSLTLGVDGQDTDTSYGAYEFNDSGDLAKLGNHSTEVVVPTPAAWQPDPTQGPQGDGSLRVGMIFPSAGPEASVGAAARAGVQVAVAELNAHGGVVGRRVHLIAGDSQDGSTASTTLATNTVLKDGADVVIGGIGQSDTSAMVGPVTSASVPLIVPGTVSTTDAHAAQSGYLFRLAPPDTVQGAVLADVVANDGITRVTIIDEGGSLDGGMAATFQTDFTARGGAVAATIAYSATDSASSVIDQATREPTNGYVLLGDLSSVNPLLAEMYARNLGPTNVATYMANISPSLATLSN